MDVKTITVSMRTWNDLTEQLEQQRMELDRLKKDRRERIATALLAGILANPALLTGQWGGDDFRRSALIEADDLIEELERENKNG